MVVLALTVHGVWRKQFVVVSAFYFVDFFATSWYCRSPFDEANLIARSFMLGFGSIPIGMFLFFLVTIAGFYALTWVVAHLTGIVEVSRSEPLMRVCNVTNFSLFAFITSLDFGFGATSWFLPVPLFYRICLGLSLYVVLYFAWIRTRDGRYRSK